METHKGTFYTPDSPDDEISGILSISESSEVKLELLGGFGDLETAPFNRKRVPITIWGDLFNGKKITLLESFRAGSETVYGKSHTESYRAQLTLIGTHVLDRHQLHFNEINVDIEMLEDWLGVIGGNLQLSFGEVIENVKYTYNQPPDINFDINKDLQGTFFFRQSYPITQDYKFELVQRTLLNITSISKKSTNEFMVAIRSFRKLLSFFIGRKVRILKCILTSYEEIIQEIPHKGGMKPIYEQIEVHYNDIEPYSNTAKNVHDFLVKYEDIATDFSRIVYHWYTHVEDKILPITSILLESLVNHPIFDETEFLTTFQGVEAFHRRCIQNTKDLQRKHKALLKEKLNSFEDETFKNWLKGRLAFAYEPTAKERLKSLLTDHRDLINGQLDQSVYDIWVKEIVDSRNYLTHYDPASSKKCVKMQKLYDYTEMLKALLAILILQYIGIDKGHLKSIGRFYSHSIHRLSNEIKSNKTSVVNI